MLKRSASDVAQRICSGQQQSPRLPVATDVLTHL